MKTKYLILTSLATLLIASCTSDEFINEVEPTSQNDYSAIKFGLDVAGQTRADLTGDDAATALNNEFIVWGEKNESDGSAAGATNLVFKNYVVQYTASTANTTQSNTHNWEYVGISPYAAAKVAPAITGTQTIKYWDAGASNYIFTAISAKKADLDGGKVIITKTESGSTAYDKGYTVTVKSGATAGDIYFADREVKTTHTSPVTLRFRNFMTKIRFGVYETVPGYKVQITKMYYNGTNSTEAFGVDGTFLTNGDNTTYTVTYGNGTTGPENKPIMTAGGSSSTQAYLTTTTGTYFNTDLGTASNAPTYDNGGTYTTIFPYPGNTANIIFKIDYKLISEDTSEEIDITEKTAEVPAAYCKWQSNYAYTYIFKITDSDLTPITFDACVVEDVNGNQETITTVDEPSITTFAVTSGGAFKTGGNEYSNTDVIYASVVDGGSVPTLTASNIALYTVTTTNATTCPITEQNVADKLAGSSSSLLTCTAKVKDTDYTIETTVPGETGVARTLSAIKWTGTGATAGNPVYYVVEYIKTARTYSYDSGQTYDADPGVQLYTESGGVYTAATWANGSTIYHTRTGVATPGTYSYKVVKVVAPAP